MGRCCVSVLMLLLVWMLSLSWILDCFPPCSILKLCLEYLWLNRGIWNTNKGLSFHHADNNLLVLVSNKLTCRTCRISKTNVKLLPFLLIHLPVYEVSKLLYIGWDIVIIFINIHAMQAYQCVDAIFNVCTRVSSVSSPCFQSMLPLLASGLVSSSMGCKGHT